jgi:hypothetical protein
MQPLITMFFPIRHILRYAYERPLFFDSTTLRLLPRNNDPAQQLLEHLRWLAHGRQGGSIRPVLSRRWSDRADF